MFKQIINNIFPNFGKIKTSNNSIITLNGVTYTGDNIIITNDKVIIDGIDYTPEKCLQIDLTITGNVENMDINYCKNIFVQGNVDTLHNTSGNIQCNDVNTLKSTSGDILCNNVSGDIKTVSGNVKSNSISGNVKTLSGNIKV